MPSNLRRWAAMTLLRRTLKVQAALWFLWSLAVGLVPRFVPGVTVGGYDPAANYRRFPEQIERLEKRYSD